MGLRGATTVHPEQWPVVTYFEMMTQLAMLAPPCNNIPRGIPVGTEGFAFAIESGSATTVTLIRTSLDDPFDAAASCCPSYFFSYEGLL